MNILKLLTNAVAAISSAVEPRVESNWTYQATITGTGAISATVIIEVSNDGKGWLTFGTLSPASTDLATDAISGNASWAMHRARLTAISGTGASVNVTAAGA